jgi:radical SAM-linked protein
MINYRIRFVKERNLKFLSHLDLIKTMERALRRGQLPVTHSEGFNPRPKLSFGPALAVGISSNDEYYDIQLLEDLEPQLIMERLNRTLPDGLKILMVKKIEHHVKPLNAIINRASYVIILKVVPEDQAVLVAYLHGLTGLPKLDVLRSTKEGDQKLVNIRPWLHNLTIEIQDAESIKIILTGEIGSGGNLRPEDIINSISLPVQVESVTRIGLWHEEKGIVMKPLDFCEKVGD